MPIFNNQADEIRFAISDDSRLEHLAPIRSRNHLLRLRHRGFDPAKRDLPTQRFLLGMICQDEVHSRIMRRFAFAALISEQDQVVPVDQFGAVDVAQ